jgi:hypothetical protein
MFIRKRLSTKHASYQIIQTYREGGKVKQRVIYNLGRHPTVDDALKTKYSQLKALEEIIRIPPTATAIAERRADIAKLEALARSVKTIQMHHPTGSNAPL